MAGRQLQYKIRELMHRILLINHYAGSPENGMEYRPYYLAKEWVNLGHQVTIVGASFSHLHVKRPAASGAATVEFKDGIRYVWLKTPSYAGNGAGRIMNMLSFVAQLRRCRGPILEGGAPDVVIAASTYPLDIVNASPIAVSCGAKIIFEVRDLWPLTPILIGGMSRRNPMILLLQWGEDLSYRRTDRVVCTLPLAESYMRERGLAAGKFIHIPNGISTREWSAGKQSIPPEHAEALEQFRREDRLIVGYAGAHGLPNALDVLVDAAAQLRDHPVAFALVGAGLLKESLQRRARELGLSSIIFLPPISKAAIPELLDGLDMLYMGCIPNPLYRYGISPNKLNDYMMAGKPVISSGVIAADPVEAAQCGIACPTGDPAAVAAAILQILHLSPQARLAMGARGRQYVEARHDYAVLARQYLEIM